MFPGGPSISLTREEATLVLSSQLAAANRISDKFDALGGYAAHSRCGQSRSMPATYAADGDTVGLLILAEEDDTLQTLARKLQDAASLRVVSRDQVQVVWKNNIMDPAMTVAQAGLQSLDRFDVISG
jgi:Toluene-4-monooxygenase system protein B (TmoB)